MEDRFGVDVRVPYHANGVLRPPETRYFDDPCDALALIDSISSQYVGAGGISMFNLKVDQSSRDNVQSIEDLRAFCGSTQETVVRESREALKDRDGSHDTPPADEDAGSLGAGVAAEPAVVITPPAPPPAEDIPPQGPPPGRPGPRPEDSATRRTTGADPVDLFTGEFFLETVDFELPSIGFPFVLLRTYKSGRTFFGPWGYNWDHNYNVYLRRLDDGRMALNTGRLQENIYLPSGDGVTFDPPRGVLARLEQQPTLAADDFILVFPDGTRWFFRRTGLGTQAERIPLVRIEDRHGNFQTLVYDNQDHLVQVIDTAGRKINFIYGECGLLEALQPEFLQTPGAPPVQIQYWHANHIEQLSAVTSFPTSDFPHGLITCYEYDEAQPDPYLRNNITRVIDAKGQTVVENVYGTDTTSDNFNRVVRQYFMGGEFLFNYTNIRYIPPYDQHINDVYQQTELYEPGRPLRVFSFNFRGSLLDERFRLCADGSYRVWAQSFQYNPQGRLIEYYHPNGMSEFFTYDETNPNPLARGNLLRIDQRSQPNGLQSRTVLKLTYEPRFQQVKTMVDEAGQTTTYTYDYENDPLATHGSLVTAHDPDAALSDGTLQTGCTWTFVSDAHGQLVEQTSPEGRKITLEYYPNGAGAGQVRKITRHDAAAPLEQAFAYDLLGNLALVEDAAGNQTHYTYNRLNQLEQAVFPAVNGKQAVYKFEYNEDRKVAREYEPRGTFSDPVITGEWIVHTYTYDAASWLVEHIQNANTQQPQITQYVRDGYGRILQETNPLGQVIRYRYDERDLLLEETQHAQSDQPLVTTYRYDRMGSLVKISLPDGGVQTFDYDENYSRLKAFQNPLGNTGAFTYGIRDQVERFELRPDSASNPAQTFTYQYDEKGRLSQAAINGLLTRLAYDRDDLTTRITSHVGGVTRMEYDGLGREVRLVDPLGNVRRSEYDAHGNLSALISEFTSTRTGQPISFRHQTGYDARYRPIQSVDPLGNASGSTYDDRSLVIETRSSQGRRIVTEYDANRLAVRSALLKPDGSQVTLHRWQRDLIGRLLAYEDAAGSTTSYEYDGRGLLSRIRYADGSSIVNTYDALGRLQTETDPNGTLTTLTYNARSQVERLAFQPAAQVVSAGDIQLEYDGFGRRVKTTQGGLILSKGYDVFNRLVEEQQGSFAVKRTFDDLNHHSLLHYPDGRQDLYRFDLRGRLREVVFHQQGAAGCLVNAFAEGTPLVEYGYDGLFLATKKYANGVVGTYDYAVDGNLRSIEWSDASGARLDGESYLYDGERRKRLALRLGPAGQHKLFNYDALDRLVEAYTGVTAAAAPANFSDQPAIDAYLQQSVNTGSATRVEKYTLDGSDTRQSWQIDATGFTPTTNALHQVTALVATDGSQQAFGYDRNGNRISDGTYRYIYDVFDNLVRVERLDDGSPVLENAYDAEGRLVRRKTRDGETTFLYDGLRAVHEIPAQGPAGQYAYGIGLDESVVQGPAAGSFFCHQDPIQSIQAISDETGKVLRYFDFESFGKPYTFDAAGSPLPTSQALIRPVFGGRPYLETPGLYDFRKRAYDPSLGLFLQRDPFDYVDSSNPYLYCMHSPLQFVDPTGTIVPILVALGILAAEGGLTTLGTAVVGGAVGGLLAGIGVNAARQSVQLASGEGFNEDGTSKKDFSVGEMLMSGGIGMLMGAGFPLLFALSAPLAIGAAGGLIYKGIKDIVGEAVAGQYYTATFDAASAILLPFAGRRLSRIQPGPGLKNVVKGQKPAMAAADDVVYSVQGDKGKIIPNVNAWWRKPLSGRIWGQTEGSVYAHPQPNAPRWKTGIDPKADPVVFRFSGENARVFQNHETTGLYSLAKHALGQKKTGFGDLKFGNARHTGEVMSVPTKGAGNRPAPVIELEGVKLLPSQFGGQRLLPQSYYLWGRRAGEHILNIPIMTALNAAPKQILSPDK